MENTNILISGGGIAGPALAYWLRRYGFTVTVVERAPAPRPGGQAVDLRGAGRTVVDRMGLLDQVRAVSLDQKGIACVNASGRLTARMPTDLFGGEGIVSEIEVLRGDLAEVLYAAIRSGVEYIIDDSITGLDPGDDSVTVTFEKAPPRRFGLVAGTDGLHSVVRRLAFGPEADYVRPIGCYTAWFTVPSHYELDGWFLMYNAPGGRVASMRPGRLPGEIKAGLSFRSGPIEAGPLNTGRRDTNRQMDILESRFAGARWEVPGLLEDMRAAPDFFFEQLGQVQLDRWSSGRAVLLGDAACCPTPLTGLGTSLALVGAYVLAGELAADDDHRAAFARYDQIMRPYAASAQELPPGGISGYAPNSALMIRMRAASMRMMGRWPVRNLVAKQFAKAADIELRDYSQHALR
jgi:2-polyprenyl-6-methoxyphenol hydroxylase-like FAD-dependent oxidoreductase